MELHPESLLLHAGLLRSNFSEANPAIYMNSGFVYKSAEEAERSFSHPEKDRFVYSRVGNPGSAMLEERLTAYEGAARCFATASGMAAVFASIACCVRAGDRVVAPYALFSSCLYIFTDILPRYGIEVTLIEDTDTGHWREALAKPARLVFFETPTNPLLDIIDIQAVADLAHEAGAIVIVDNVFATPMLQKPLRLGADVVVYSATKHMDGQGRCNGGAILCNEEFAGLVAPFVRHTGPMLSQFNAWVLFHGLETLELRVKAQCANAAHLVDYLAGRREIASLRYPFHASHPQRDIAQRQMSAGGTLIAFDVAGGKEKAFALMNALRLILISNNLGDSKTLITHPRTTTHFSVSDADCARAGIGPGTVRLSVGLENAEDLLYDVDRAFALAGKA